MRWILIILLFISCSPKLQTIRSECSGYFMTEHEYNLSQKGVAWHPPRINFIHATDTMLTIIDYYPDEGLYVAIPFIVDVSLTETQCKYKSSGTVFVLNKKQGTLTVNHISDKGFEPYWVYRNLLELDYQEAKQLLRDFH